MTKKYELLENDTVNVDNKTLYRIKALKSFGNVTKGDLGGYVQSDDNLSRNGFCWIYDNALVYDNAKVYDNARVSGSAKVYGNTWIYDNARIFGSALVYDNARVYDNALVYDNARVSGSAKVYGSAVVTKLVQNVITHKHNITLTDNHIIIGCENHTISYWIKNIKDIGKRYGYSKKEIKAISKILNGLLMMRDENGF